MKPAVILLQIVNNTYKFLKYWSVFVELLVAQGKMIKEKSMKTKILRHCPFDNL